MKYYLFIAILTFSCVFPAYGKKNEPCEKAVQLVMEKYWNGILTTENIDDAIKHCTDPAKKNDIEAQYDLSMLFILKNNNKEDKQSCLWTLKAAENNHVDAQFHLGQMYENGNVVETKPDLAISWYEKAANNGLVIAQRKLGGNYLSGIITKKNVVKSIYWYEKAAAQCDKLSIIKLIEIYSKEIKGTSGNPQKVDYWNEKYTACNVMK